MSIGVPGGPLRPAGGSARVEFLATSTSASRCHAHTIRPIETATFSEVDWHARPRDRPENNAVNTLETISLRSKDRRVVHVVTQPGRIEAPNWFPDTSNTLYFNNGGRLFKLQADPPGTKPNPGRLEVPETVDLGFLTRINNDHGVSNDGQQWAISDQSQTVSGQRPSLIYTVPVGGGRPKLVTEKGPSYFHGWSPDGKALTYCGQRDGNFDIYTVSVSGGPETRLTTDAGKDDGPEYLTGRSAHLLQFRSHRRRCRSGA